MSDPVNHPPHYRATSGIEAIDVVEGYELNFRLGNCVTYILRADRKGESLKDLKKARWYLEREIVKREPVSSAPDIDLRGFGLCYLATPYTKYPAGIENAFQEAAALAGRLLCAGVKVYSPIAHTHPIAHAAALDPLDHGIWLPFDQAMMERADILVIAMMRGWERSFGIQQETRFFTEAGKPICFLDPSSLQTSAYLKDRA